MRLYCLQTASILFVSLLMGSNAVCEDEVISQENGTAGNQAAESEEAHQLLLEGENSEDNQEELDSTATKSLTDEGTQDTSDAIILPTNLTKRHRWLFTKCQIILSDKEQKQFVSLAPGTRRSWLEKMCNFRFENSNCNPTFSAEEKKEMFDLPLKDRCEFLHSVCNGAYKLFKKCEPSLTPEQQREFKILPAKTRLRWLELYCKDIIPSRQPQTPQARKTSPQYTAPFPQRSSPGLRVAAHTLFWPGLVQTGVSIGMGVSIRKSEDKAYESLEAVDSVQGEEKHTGSNLWFVSAGIGGAIMISGVACTIAWHRRQSNRWMASFRDQYLTVSPLPRGQGLALNYGAEF